MEKRGSTILNQVKFTWIISEARNIFNLKTGECIYSPPITDGKKLKWIIKLYPNGMNETCKDYVSLFIGLGEKRSTEYSTIKLRYEIFFLNNQNELLKAKVLNSDFRNMTASIHHTSPAFFGEAYTGEGWSKYLPKIQLQNNLNNFINENGDLKLYCEIIKESKISNLEGIIKQPSNDEEIICIQCSSFEKVLNNETFSDIKLIVGNVIFSAHKVILAAKSPVFMTIIENSLVQTIEINDINASVIKEMLRYMYIGTVENIQDIDINLLAAASKYQMQSLMKLCQDNLIKSMSLTNAIDLLVAAETHDAKNLKSEAIKMISANIKVLRKSEDWSKLNLKLVTEILDVVVT